MNRFSVGSIGGSCTPIRDDQYSTTLINMIGSARRRCLCSIFIVNFNSQYAGFTGILEALEDARWLGVDVRVLIGGSRENYNIAESSASARAIFQDRKIFSHWLTSRPMQQSSHAKFVIVDDTTLLGSHNWSQGAFTNQIQDSIQIHSPDLASFLAGFFNRQWRRGEM